MELISTYVLQRRKGKGSITALSTIAVHLIPEAMLPRMDIIPNSEKLQNEISSFTCIKRNHVKF